jgi:hypothetical protein
LKSHDFASVDYYMKRTCQVSLNGIDLSGCSALGLSIVDWATLLGGLALLIALARWMLRWLIANRTQKINTFRELCRSLSPLMDDNSRIFNNFGPNSGTGDGRPKAIRYDMTAWNAIKTEIGCNNQKLKFLISRHSDLVLVDHEYVFQRWISHIDAFAAHLRDVNVDYRHHQFPADVITIVHDNA